MKQPVLDMVDWLFKNAEQVSDCIVVVRFNSVAGSDIQDYSIGHTKLKLHEGLGLLEMAKYKLEESLAPGD